jgi:diguanylate cyclase (GGDEF)-like protein
MGDNVIIELAKLLSLHFKKDLVSRFGRAEFGILINGQDEASIEKRIEYLRLAVQKHITIAKKVEHQFTVSIGTTMMNDDESLQYLLKEADQALHQAIEKGGNQSVIKGFIELG